MTRKYRQHGYQDNDRGREKQQKTPRPQAGPKEFRAPRMPGFQDVLRCSICGAIIPPPVEIARDSRCPKCQADLHTCKNCRHFDTSAQFECTQPILERIYRKDTRNECQYFDPRMSVERETKDGGAGSGKPSVSPSSARTAFDNLFK